HRRRNEGLQKRRRPRNGAPVRVARLDVQAGRGGAVLGVASLFAHDDIGAEDADAGVRGPDLVANLSRAGRVARRPGSSRPFGLFGIDAITLRRVGEFWKRGPAPSCPSYRTLLIRLTRIVPRPKKTTAEAKTKRKPEF